MRLFPLDRKDARVAVLHDEHLGLFVAQEKGNVEKVLHGLAERRGVDDQTEVGNGLPPILLFENKSDLRKVPTLGFSCRAVLTIIVRILAFVKPKRVRATSNNSVTVPVV